MIRDGENDQARRREAEDGIDAGAHAGQHGVELFGERLREKVQRTFLSSTSGPGFKYVGNTEFPEIIEVFEATFAKLKKLKPDVFLASHGSAFDLAGKNVPARRQEPWKSLHRNRNLPGLPESTETAFRNKVAEERAAQ